MPQLDALRFAGDEEAHDRDVNQRHLVQVEDEPRPVSTLAEGEKELIEAALAASRGRISGPLGAAATLGIPRQTLESKIKALHIDRLSARAR